jgi:sugar phosphate isomerase/epimerase
MILRPSGGESSLGVCHLTYCSNIHPGETWAEVRRNLGEHVPAVRARLALDRPFGIGLRLSAQAAGTLAQPEVMRELRDFLAREQLYVFTLNGFPYGTFHGTRVKEDVYLPDWRDERRLTYTNQLADLMAELMTDPDGPIGSVSTVPGAFKANARTSEAVHAMADMMVRHAAHLVQLRARTGKHVTLALEPEPCCFLETVEESVAFFRDYLFADPAVRRLSTLTGLTHSAAQQALRDHLGLCLDLCHAAVEFEDAQGCLARLQQAGIGVYKLQISAGLRLPELSEAALAGVRQFDDPVYLHQVVESGPSGLVRYDDLPDALRATQGRSLKNVEWRVHCHVPIFLDDLGAFSSTQSFIREMLQAHRRRPISTHLEVETYTWNVLPPHVRTDNMDHAIARELAWAREELERS